jgi:1-acyl-sn-glycerol-3-phosphate acyltransferase
MKVKLFILLLAFCFCVSAPAPDSTMTSLKQRAAKTSLWCAVRTIGEVVAQGLSLRYSVRPLGYAEIEQRGTKGVLFLMNHPTWGVDPFINVRELRRFWIRPIIYEEEYEAVSTFVDLIDPIIVPDMKGKSRADVVAANKKWIGETVQALREGRNVGFWVEGERTPEGAVPRVTRSGLHNLLKALKDDPEVRIVVVRLDNLSGSGFARGGIHDEKTMKERLLWMMRILAANLVVLVPRRDVPMRFRELGEDFPRNGTREEIYARINYIFAHDPEPPPRTEVPYYFWQQWWQFVSSFRTRQSPVEDELGSP